MELKLRVFSAQFPKYLKRTPLIAAFTKTDRDVKRDTP
jgi:hypothetical protein